MATTRHMRMYPRPKLVIRTSQSGMRRVMGDPSVQRSSHGHWHRREDLLHHLPLPAARTEAIGGDREDAVSEDGVGHGLGVVGRRVVAPLHKGIRLGGAEERLGPAR